MTIRRLLLMISLWAVALSAAGKDAKDGKDAGEGVVNKLLAPGPLISDHKNLEHGDCLKCHDAGQGVPDGKCLACHTPIQKSIKEKNTFHGNTKAPCIGCHSDHKGRNFDSTKVNQKTFNHAETGFTLHGAHAKVACARCHTEKKDGQIRFFGKTESCISCHKKDDIHFFTGKFATKECSTCHVDTTWKGAKFDHKKDTGYALVGDHAKLSCAKCHVPKGKSSAKYDFPELKTQACLTCHVDFHRGNLDGKFKGGNCDTCHNQDTWKIGKFDHAVTGFVLRGKHQAVACIDCHKPAGNKNLPLKDLNFTGLKQECNSCHVDYHGYRQETNQQLGPLSNCQTCHTESAWKPPVVFNHNVQPNFKIDGKHVGVKCFSCHIPKNGGGKKVTTSNIPRTYEFPQLEAKTCETCHKSPHTDTPPTSAFRTQKCTTCHVTDGWKVFNKMSGGGFNHNMTRFPLTGDHVKLSCNSCHLQKGKQTFKFAGENKQFCETCHKSVHKPDQFEKKLLDASCATCHDTVNWKPVTKFNHDSARFKLTGAHAKLASDCGECHKPIPGKTIPTKPPHPKDKFVFEHPQTGFCVDCHTNIHAKAKQFSGNLPTNDCQQCHNVNKWTDLATFNHDKTRFRIVGAHAKFKNNCVRCHVKTDKMLATKPPRPAGKFAFGHADEGFCESCHKSVHAGQFKKEFQAKPCTDCHTQTTFEKRLPFDHDTTDFKIAGAHLKFRSDCVKCHTKTDKTLPTNPPKPASLFLFKDAKDGYCEACHVNEHKGQFHTSLAKAPCTSCHYQTDFAKHNKFDHHKARYDLKGKHLKVKCGDCHIDTKPRYTEPPHHHKGKFVWENLYGKDCALCHKDPHLGRYGKQCSNCHTPEGWDVTANFHKDFVLTGVHYLLECNECHVDKRQLTGTGNDCKTCHQKDDVHKGTQPECADCHTQQFWSAARFQHSLTDFPLRGAHRLLECADCHAGGVYQGRSTECTSCHLEDALKVTFPNHQLAGFQQCEDCHNQFSFRGAKK